MKVALAMTSRVRNRKRQGLTITSKLMADYLVQHYPSVLIVDQPIKTEPDTRPLISLYKLGQPVEDKTAFLGLFRWSLKLSDMEASLRAVWAFKPDIFIAGEVLNGLVGIFLRKFGRVKKVVYMAGDHWLGRKGNFVKVWLFERLDTFVAKLADYVLNTTEADGELRRGKTEKPMFNIPSLCPPILESHFFKRSNHNIVYLGGMDKRLGIDRAIGAMPAVVERFPDAHLHIAGWGEKPPETKDVTFYGFKTDDEMGSFMREMRLGVAPYVSGATLDSGKLRLYAWFGIPSVVSTEAPESAKIAAQFKAGVICKPTSEEIAKAVIWFFSVDEDESFINGCKNLARFYDSAPYFDGLFAMLEGKPHQEATNFGTDRMTIFSK